MNDSTLSGYCAFNIWGYNQYIEVTDSTLIGINKWSGADDGFGTIAFDADTTFATNDYVCNSYVKIINSKIEAKKGGTAEHSIVTYNGGYVGAMNCTAEIIKSSLIYEDDLYYCDNKDTNHLLIDGEEQIK